MLINLVYDNHQYDLILDLLAEELKLRNHSVVCTRWHGADKADCSIVVQSINYSDSPRPKFFIWHGAGITKKHKFNIDIDYFFAPTETWKKYVEKQMDKSKYEILVGFGHPEIDLLAGYKYYEKKHGNGSLKKMFLGVDTPLIVYAPTWRIGSNKQKNAREVSFGDVLNELRNYSVILMPHLMETSEKNHPGAIYPKGASRLKYIASADLLVTDISGAAYWFAVMDKPIVLIDRHNNPDYLTEKVSGKKLDIGESAFIEELRHTVIRNLLYPNMFKKQREFWVKEVIGRTDGQNCKRIIDKIEEVVHGIPF